MKWIAEPHEGRELRRGIAACEISIQNQGEETVFGHKAVKFEGIFPNELCEYYGFEDLTLNAGLRREDFDPGNPQYKF